MSAVPASSYLIEFGDASLRRRNDGGGSADDVSARIEAAHASGFKGGKAAAMATLEARLEEQEQAFVHRLAAERQAWVAQVAETLSACLAAGLGELEIRIGEVTARVLEPFLRAEVCREVIADLGADLDVLLTKSAGLSMSVAGPEDLLQALRDRLADKDCAVTWLPNNEPDVRITAGQTILETRLGAWAGKIAEAIR